MFWLRAIQFALLTFCMGSSSFTASRLGAANAPVSAAQIALYQGADREKILIEGAKKEGQLVFYNSHTWFKAVAQEFEKKYPFIKVTEWRTDADNVMKRVIEENRAGRFLSRCRRKHRGQHRWDEVKTIYSKNTRRPSCAILRRRGGQRKKRRLLLGRPRDLYQPGFQHDPCRRCDAPKRLNDLLDPKLKGKMSLAGGATSARWVGDVMESAGREFIEKLGRHDISVHELSGAALANLVVTGEVPISPTIFDSNIFVAKRKGAPVEWLPVEPVVANVGYSGIVSNAPHPHAALLLIDYLLSKEGPAVHCQRRSELAARRCRVAGQPEVQESLFRSEIFVDE